MLNDIKILKTIAKNIKQNIKEEIAAINFTETEIHATDSYFAVILPNTTGITGLYANENFSNELVCFGDKFLTKDGIVFEPKKLDKHYPSFDSLIPQNNETYFSFNVQAMAKLLDIAKKSGVHNLKFCKGEKTYCAEENGIKFIIAKNK